MIIKPELVKKIKEHFSLNVYETKVWLSLLGKGVASAGEIADISGIPRSRTYDVLESLEKQGFAIAKVGKPVKYLAVKPSVVIEKIKNNLLKNTEDKITVLSNLKGTNEYSELEDLHKQSIDPIKHKDISTAIRGKHNIFGQLSDMIENASKEVVICTSAKEIERKSRLFSRVFDILKNNSIKLKIALNGSEEEIKRISSKIKLKVKRSSINARFYVIDQKEIIFMITNLDQDEEEVGIWLNSEFFAKAMSQLFDASHN